MLSPTNLPTSLLLKKDRKPADVTITSPVGYNLYYCTVINVVACVTVFGLRVVHLELQNFSNFDFLFPKVMKDITVINNTVIVSK